MRPALAPLAASVLAAACAPEPPEDEMGDEWEVEVNLAPCGFGEPTAATVKIFERHDIFHGDAFSRIEALVESSPPVPMYAVVQSEGSCRYLQHQPGHCDPICGVGQTCSMNSECLAIPESVGAGTLTVKGLGDPIELEAADFAPGSYTLLGGLPGDLFSEADAVGTRFTGDAFPSVTLGARGVSAMARDLTATGYEMLDGQDATITWTPGPDPNVCVHLSLNGFNVAHGAPLADIIQCEGKDTGTMVVPQALVEMFPPGETPEVTEGFDWPHSELTRYSRSSVQTDSGRAELVVSSTAAFRLSHPE